MFARNKIAMVVAEFLGTAVLTLVVLAVQRSTIGIAYFVAIAAGLAVASLSYVFSNASGAHFNPAVTIGAWTARRVKTLPAITYIVAQLLGAWAAYGIYTYFVNSSLQEIGGHATFRIFVAEAVGAFLFVFIWAAVAAQRLSANLVGAGLTLGIIVASVASIGFVNPAVALGARAWDIWGSMGWATYVAGPVVGGLLGYNLYEAIFNNGGLWFPAVKPAAAKVSVSKPVAKSPAKKSTAKKRK
ncbi:MAG TPA: aquaporin [Candidatus Microsaccharimonas sp.]|nr:aquaporin [Candidatus Microsaccharimonas sp.]